MQSAITIKIIIESTNSKILKSKKHFLIQFCKIFFLNYIHMPLPTKKKKIALLRSPHIHKKTWRTYILKTVKFKFEIYFPTIERFSKAVVKFNTLIKILSINCRIKVNFLS